MASDALKKIFVIEDSIAWKPNLRSKTAIRTSDTRYFVDPSIAVAALGLGPNDLMNDLKTMGLLFETLCIRDLRVFAGALDRQVYHFQGLQFAATGQIQPDACIPVFDAQIPQFPAV